MEGEEVGRGLSRYGSSTKSLRFYDRKTAREKNHSGRVVSDSSGLKEIKEIKEIKEKDVRDDAFASI